MNAAAENPASSPLLDSENQPNLTDAENAWIAEHPTFRVAATPDWPPFEIQEDDGAYAGISADFIRLAAKKVGLTPKIHFDKWKSLVAKLKSRELDVAPGLNGTDDRRKFLAFTNFFVEQHSVIFATNDREDISAMADLSGKTVAVEQGYALAEVFAREYPEIKLVLVENSFEAIKKVSLKQADAYVGNQVVGSYLTKKNMITNLRAVGFFPGRHGQLRFGIRSDWPILRDILNKGLAAITTSERNRILGTYIDVDHGLRQKTVSLTDEEREWVNGHPVIRVAAHRSFPPLEFFDKSGAYKGYTADLLGIVAKRIGFKIEAIPMSTGTDAKAALASNQADVQGAAVKSAQPLTAQLQTGVYQNFPAVILVSANRSGEVTLEKLKGMTVATAAGSAEASYLHQHYPDLDLTLVDDSRTGLNRLAFGDFDAFVALLPTASHVIQEEGITSLRVGGRLPVTFDFVFGVRRDGPILARLLDKAIASISQEEKNQLLARWISLTVHEGVDIWVVVRWGSGVGSVALVIFLVIVAWNRRLGREIAERKRVERRLQFTQHAVDKAAETIFWVRLADGGFDYVNDTACDVLKYSRDEMLNMTVPQIDLNFTPERLGALSETLNREHHAEFESQHKTSDGDVIDVDVLVYLADYEDRRLMVANVKDITKRKQAERKLEDAYSVISGSIEYASRIQRAILPDNLLFDSAFSDYFIFWQPRDVVGGDIYWAGRWGDGFVLVLGDCTGHGVPGAFMSLITTDAMRRSVNEVAEGKCGAFLQHVHTIVQTTLGQHGNSGESDDGMELGVCYFEPAGKEMVFSGARFGLHIVKQDKVDVITPTKSGIGYRGIPLDQHFEENRISLTTDKTFYMTSDGLIDQIGGERRRGFGRKRFKALLLEIQDQPLTRQRTSIETALVQVSRTP